MKHLLDGLSWWAKRRVGGRALEDKTLRAATSLEGVLAAWTGGAAPRASVEKARRLRQALICVLQRIFRR